MRCYLTALLLSSRVVVVLQRQIITLRQCFEPLQPCARWSRAQRARWLDSCLAARRIDAEASAGIEFSRRIDGVHHLRRRRQWPPWKILA